jgi:hypothetical protein
MCGPFSHLGATGVVTRVQVDFGRADSLFHISNIEVQAEF